MKFRDDSDEELCGKSIPSPRHGALACLRTAEHGGNCISVMRDAGRADGVCWECRVPIETPHRDDCHAGGNK